jgi:putative nucleotidyltransferase with HDIG domain
MDNRLLNSAVESPCPSVPLERAGEASLLGASGWRSDMGLFSETEEILFSLAQAVEQRDEHGGGHCHRIAVISVALGTAMGLDRASLLALYRGGYLHDVGKVGIPDSILFKPARLSAEEWVIMRSHTVRGEEICRPMKSLASVLPIIRHHHERFDGTGYPDGLRDSQIPLLARVLQVADIYDALTSPRPYKPTYTAEEAVRIMQEETARGWRDPQIMEVFLGLQHSLASRILRYAGTADRTLMFMRESMNNLQQLLAADARAVPA